MSTSLPPVQTSFDNYLRQSWFHRNWKWFVPTLLVMAVVCFGVMVLSLVQYSFRNSGVFEMALVRARHSPRVVEAVGPSIKTGWFIGGSIQTKGATGWAELSIPISAERGEGTVFIRASKRANVWEPSVLVFENDGGDESIDLLREAAPAVMEQ
jgi:hypothetical protein